jgi:hypothetical protein
MLAGIVLLALAQGMASCGGSSISPAPTAPSPAGQAPVPPPGSFNYGPGYVLNAVSLSGVVFEMTPTGQVPVEGVGVYCDACGVRGHSTSFTDRSGVYSFSGDIARGGGVFLADGVATPLVVSKEGYDVTDPDGTGTKNVTITGDTRFDIQIVRR